MTYPRQIATPAAPTAIGPYVQAVDHQGLLHVSGQLPLKPDGSAVAGTMVDQVTQCLANVEAIVVAAGASVANILSTKAYLVDINDYTELNLAYESFFGTEAPAREVIGVAALPRAARVEIAALAASRTLQRTAQ